MPIIRDADAAAGGAERIVKGDRRRLEWGGASITGDFRENNEDRLFIDAQGRFFLVADGMGGQSAGERASELAVEVISRRLSGGFDFSSAPPKKVVEAVDGAIGEANAEIMALGEVEPACKNMGTTIAYAVLVQNEFFIGGIGDSRAYLLRDGKLEQLTEDHSLTQALVKAGTITPEEALTHRYKNVLYRYLGTKDGGTGSLPVRRSIQPGDRFLLCSDGISDGIEAPEILQILSAAGTPQQAAEQLVQGAQAGGSRDNITCVVVFAS